MRRVFFMGQPLLVNLHDLSKHELMNRPNRPHTVVHLIRELPEHRQEVCIKTRREGVRLVVLGKRLALRREDGRVCC